MFNGVTQREPLGFLGNPAERTAFLAAFGRPDAVSAKFRISKSEWGFHPRE